jgi:hypothetical protein
MNPDSLLIVRRRARLTHIDVPGFPQDVMAEQH